MHTVALTELVQRFSKPLRRYLNQHGARAYDIDDIAQEVWLRLNRYANPETIENPLAYINMTAINVMRERSQRSNVSKPHLPIEDVLLELPLDVNAPERELLREQRTAHVKNALWVLTPRQRNVLMLHEQDLSYRQIAAQLGISERSVLRDLTRARAKLRRVLSREDLYD